ncbi:MAG: adenosylmethionine decarboxylase [Candidatus Aenigmarchaeota archaeon]|nr:adenosylmethionine decarboxylase [Candidatus Aenigmarchaeota archaeon]
MGQSAFGPHVMVDASKCVFDKLVDYDLVFDILDNLPAKLGMTKMTAPYVVKWLDKFGTVPGVSGFVMIAESHISIHTFPDQDYVFIDIFSCREFDTEKAIKYLVSSFGAKKVTTKVIKRGLDFDRNKCCSPLEARVAQKA